MTATTRADIVDALRNGRGDAPALPATFKIIDQPRQIDEPRNGIDAVMVVERTRVEAAPNVQGSYFESINLWVIEPSQDMDTLEDSLDASLDQVLELIAKWEWCTFQSAERSTFGDVYHAYTVTIQVVSTIEATATDTENQEPQP